jgi:predicted O-methyltransferase YrrM
VHPHFLFAATSYLRYWLEAVDEHSLHAPFLFDFYTHVIRKPAEHLPLAEQLRAKLLADHRTLAVDDPGSGSKHARQPIRTIQSITMHSVSPVKFAALYARIIAFAQAKTVVELGTSLGITTLYLGQQPDTKIYTFEGSKAVAEVAATTFSFAQTVATELIHGNLDHTLAPTLGRIAKVDVALLDANHSKQPTLRYFEQLLARAHEKSIFILDDIHDSPEMTMAWKEVQHHPLVYLSIDLFRCGLVFFDPSLNKQHVVLQF